MADLVAQGALPQQRLKRHLTGDGPLTIGRAGSALTVDWDALVSRKHVEVELVGDRLHVQQLPDATNPVFFHGKQLTQFYLSPGEHFVIGNTKFMLVTDRIMVSMDMPVPDAEQTFNPEYLRQIDYRDAGQKISVLNQLPDVVSRSANDNDLISQLVNILMTGIRRANTIALVEVNHVDGQSPVNILHWDQRIMIEGDFQPSWKLIQRAIEANESVLHYWKHIERVEDDAETIAQEGDWAFVTPLTGELSEGWVIYVSGRYDPMADSDSSFNPQDLRDDIKFTELIAATLANFRQVKALERSQASLRSFFSPVVLDLIAGEDPEDVLAPRQCEVAVLFCDVRGFSLKSERYAEDLHEFLDRVSQALGVTTREILNQRGVVGDFQGDSAMGFWGWPLDQPDRALRACRAALRIQQEFDTFSAQPDHPLNDFQVGLGIASGSAVAGKIGTSDQVKVTVFGPVVNIASRIETMTRRFQAGILVDENTAKIIRRSNIADQIRIRRLAVVQPFGMQSAITLNQILPPRGSGPTMTDDQIAIYESALDDFIAGRWESAFEQLHNVPAGDKAKDFLTVYIAQHNRVAPADWKGFITLQQK